jgi:hypothetical protein
MMSECYSGGASVRPRLGLGLGLGESSWPLARIEREAALLLSTGVLLELR